MIVAVAVGLLVAVTVVIALAIRSSRQPARESVAVAVEREPALTQQALPEPVMPEPEPEPQPVITWTAALTASALDEPARLHLIDDLALLTARWTRVLLRRAYQEESSEQVRARIESVLASEEPVSSTS